MKALYFDKHGPISNLTLGTVSTPTPHDDEVLIQVKACALNHLDLWVLEGWPGLKLDMPHIGGADIAGLVTELGANVSGWNIGDRVVVNPGITTLSDEWTANNEDSLSPGYRILGEGRRGGLAEFVTVPAKNLLKLPEGIDYTLGAALPLVGLTAWRMLKHRAQLKGGETVLIVGAGGGLNSFCIRLASHLKAKVIALTSSNSKAEKALSLGAAEVINYRERPDWSRLVREMTNGRGVDVVVDNVGAKTFPQSLLSACRGGRIVTVGNTSGPIVSFDNRLLFGKQLSILGSTMGSQKDFAEALPYYWQHRIFPVIDRVLSLDNAVDAYKILANGEQFGKVVVSPTSAL